MEKIICEMVCPFCGKKHIVVVEEEGFRKWQEGELIQKALPSLSATEREQLISDICPKCQADIFGTEPEEVDDEEIDISDFDDEVAACMAESLAFTGQWW